MASIANCNRDFAAMFDKGSMHPHNAYDGGSDASHHLLDGDFLNDRYIQLNMIFNGRSSGS